MSPSVTSSARLVPIQNPKTLNVPAAAPSEQKDPLLTKITDKKKLPPLADSAVVFATEKQPIIRIDIRELINTIEPILSHPKTPKTPLLIDRSNRVDIFFQYSGEYSGLFIEAKKILVETMISKKQSMSQALESLRLDLVTAMKYGKTLVIRMSDTATDFMHKFTRDDSFPVADLFVEGGRRFHLEEFWSKVVREEDRTNGVFVVRPGFCVVITTNFEMDSFEEFLSKALPMHALVPIYIEPAPESPAKPFI